MLHFYSGQVRRFLTQFMRILNNFSVETGRGKDDQIALRPVPVVYGDATRQVANIIRNNSENALNYAPKIACYIRELNYDRERMQNPYHIEKQHLRERKYSKSFLVICKSFKFSTISPKIGSLTCLKFFVNVKIRK